MPTTVKLSDLTDAPNAGTTVHLSQLTDEPQPQQGVPEYGSDAWYGQKIGALIPQSAVPALTWIQENVNDPLNAMAAKGSQAGREIGRDVVSNATMLTHPDYVQASLPSPYGPKPPVMSPEALATQEHPVALGVAGGVGSVAGGAVADPRNWPFFASGMARPILQRVIAGGFGAMMGKEAISAAKDLSDNWDNYSPEQRAELATKGGLSALMATASLAHAVTGGETAKPTRGLRIKGSGISPKVESQTVPLARLTDVPPDVTIPPAPIQAPSSTTLNSSLIPGIGAEQIDKFYAQDVAPKLAAAKTGLSETLNTVVSTLYPRVEEGGLVDKVTGLGVPEKALNSIMQLKGERDKAAYLTSETMRGIGTMFDRIPEQSRIDFIDRVKTGQQQPTQELNSIADFYRKADDRMHQEITHVQRANGWSDGDTLPYRENHFRVLWKVLPGATEDATGGFRFGRSPLEGSKGFTKKATLEDISSGIERGGVPVSSNPQKLFELSQADSMKYLTSQRMWKSLKDGGFVQFVKRGGQMPDGFSPLNDKLAKVYFPAKSGEGMIEPGQWAVESNSARLLNNYLSTDLLRAHALGRGLLGAKNFSTALELSISGFHAVFESFGAIGSDIGLGLHKIVNRGLGNLDPKALAEGAADIATSPAAPFTTARLGGSAIRYLKNPEEFLATTRGADFIKQYPEAQQAIDDLFSAGGRLKMHEDYRVQTGKTFREALNEGNTIGAALRAFPALGELIQKPLFDSFIPRLKVGQFLREYAEALKQNSEALDAGKITRQKLARRTWDLVEDRYGELNFDNLFWNRTLKSSLQLGIRSVTWQLGNLRLLGKATVGQAAEIAAFSKAVLKGAERPDSKLPLPKLTPAAATALGTLITTAIAATVIQKTMTGTYPSDAKDFIFPKIGGINAQGKPNRISIPGYPKVEYGLLTQPKKTLAGAQSSIISRTGEVFANKDYRGAEIYDPQSGAAEKGTRIAEHLLPLPMSFTNFQRAKQNTGSGWKAIPSTLGFNQGPRDIDMTPAEKMARDYVAAKIPATQSAGHADTTQLKSQLTAEARNKDQNLSHDLHAALADEKISFHESLNIRKKANQSYLGGLFQHLSPVEAITVWDAATAQEQKELRIPLIEKMSSLDEQPPKRRAVLMAAIKEALSQQKKVGLKIKSTK